MAQLVDPLSDTNPYTYSEVQLRTKPDLPEHVLGQIKWLTSSENPGYYLWDDIFNKNRPVEFLEHNWFYITRFEEGDTYTTPRDRIQPYSNNTGYWKIGRAHV